MIFVAIHIHIEEMGHRVIYVFCSFTPFNRMIFILYRKQISLRNVNDELRGKEREIPRV